jgi:copper homeostasis protein
MKRTIEICAGSAQSCVEAEAGGADRVELCAALAQGGITPGYGEIRMARQLTTRIAIHLLIRPRGGDFLYTPTETETMLHDIDLAGRLQLQGVVFGCLTPQGDPDIALMRRLKDAAAPSLSVTCHRAFDVCRDPFLALEQLIDLGFDRILTSGQQPAAVQGIPLIRELVRLSDGRIIIMPGAGVRGDNIDRIEAETGAKEFHTSAGSILPSRMVYREKTLPMGGSLPTASAFETLQTDRRKVAECLVRRNNSKKSIHHTK